MERKSKNTRRPRFSVDELDALVDAVSHRRETVYNKSSDVITNQSKNATWSEITQAVNEISRVKREVNETRRKWKDWQSTVKAKEQNRRKLKGNTEDGHQIVLSAVEEKVVALLGETALEGIQDDVDSSLLLQQHPDRKNCLKHLQEDVTKEEMIVEVEAQELYEEDEPADNSEMVKTDDEISTLEASQSKKSKFPGEVDYRDEINRQLLNVELERLDVEKQRLAIEKERLQIEREKLELLRHHFNTSRTTNEPTHSGPIINAYTALNM